MARVVVLTFEDNTAADDFVAEGQYSLVNGDVVMMVALPTLFCPGSGGGGCGTGRVKGWTRGTKFGWWVCATCHKPSSNGEPLTLVRAVVSQGTNLLDPEDDSEESVFDEGWGAIGNG